MRGTKTAKADPRRNSKKAASGPSAGGKPSVQRLIEDLPSGPLDFIEPMKCRISEQLPVGSEWAYEIKFDGFRGLAVKDGKDVRLYSRNHRELGPKFPEVIAALQKLPCEQLMLDGELVALDPLGRSSFQLLQGATEPGARSAGLFFYIFDLLHVNGRDTTALPLRKRKALLQTLIEGKSGALRLSNFLHGSMEELSSVMQPMGLEGLIAKRRESAYESGARSGSWVKFKWSSEQEFVIGGYTHPEGSRPYFGAVLAGYYDGPKLIFAGKVGTGFNAKSLKSMHDRFQEIRAEKTPFANLPERGGVIGPAKMRFCKWVQPLLVCQVRFTEWTRDHHLRQPVFLGLRDDKDPLKVVREQGSER